jgi:EF hand domain-containing protein
MTPAYKRILAAAATALAAGVALTGVANSNTGFGHHGGPFGMVMLDMLSTIDTNNDGALSQQEINAAVASRFATFDSNKDGQLSMEEFQALWADLTRPIAVRAFQFLDPDGNGAIAREEIDKRFGTLVARFDRNKDGQLSSEDRPHHREHGWRPWGGEQSDE